MGVFIRRRLAMGWLPDYPDFRDITVNQKTVPKRLERLGQASVNEMLSKTGAQTASKVLPKSVSLASWFSPI